MDNNCIISVILALYNGEKYILDQLNSLLTQSMAVDQVLITDDGSTDNSICLVKNFISEHHLENNWFLFKNERNIGPSGNFINMCMKAKGEYIFFCDQDDIWMTDKVEKMYKIISKNRQIRFLYADVINTYDPIRKMNEQQQTNSTNVFNEEIECIKFSPTNYFF